jgi:uncharacterized protein (TIGR03435 family)
LTRRFVFDAIDDELGLTLNKTPAPVKFLVVDRVEKVPTETDNGRR